MQKLGPDLPKVESKPPSWVSHLRWLGDEWSAGGRRRLYAFVVGLILFGGICLPLYNNFKPRSPTPNTEAQLRRTETGPQAEGATSAIATQLSKAEMPPTSDGVSEPTSDRSVIWPTPRHRKRGDVVETLFEVREKLELVRFIDYRETSHSQAWTRLRDNAWKLARLEDSESVTNSEHLAQFRKDYLVLRPEIKIVQEAASRLHEVVLESAENYDLLGPLHSTLAGLDGELLEGLAVLEAYEKLATAPNPVRPPKSVLNGFTFPTRMAKVRQAVGDILESLDPKSGRRREPGEMNDRFAAGVVAYNASEFEKAKLIFTAVLAEHPLIPEAQFNLGLIALRQKQAAEAERWFTEAIASNEKFAPAHASLASILAERRDWVGAMEHIRKAITINATEIRYRMILGEFLDAQKKYHEAADAYRDAVALDPTSWDANWNCAESLWLAGDHGAAQRAFERCIKLRPGSGIALQRLAEIAWSKNERESAVQLLNRAIEVQPTLELLELRAGYAFELKKFPQSRDDYEAALASEPKRASVRWGLARVLHAQGNRADAIAVCRQTLADTPDHVSSTLLLSVLLMEARQYQETEDLLLHAIRRHPKVPELVNNLAHCYIDDRRPDFALPVLRRGIVDFPSALELHSLLARQHVMRGENEQAAKVYGRAVELAPINQDLRIAYAESLLKMKQVAEAVVQFEELLKLDPTNESYRSALKAARKRKR